MALKTQAKPSNDKAARYKKLLEKVNNLKLDQGGFWKPPAGKSDIRILPGIGKMDDIFFVEVGVHYLDDDTRFICPAITAGQDCPLCQVNEALFQAGDKEQAKKFRATRAFYMNIIDRKDPDAGPQVWTPGITILQQITPLINDPDYGDITDVDEGFDIKLERTGEKRETKYSLRPARNPTPLSTDGDQAEEWLANAKDLHDSIFDQILPFDELAKKAGVDAYFASTEEEPEEEPKSRSKAAPAKRKPEPEPEPEDEEEAEEEEEPPARRQPTTTATSAIKSKLTERTQRAGLVRK